MMPEISLPQEWLTWVAFIITVLVGLAIKDWASDIIAALSWRQLRDLSRWKLVF